MSLYNSVILCRQTPNLCWNVCCKASFEPKGSCRCHSAVKGLPCGNLTLGCFCSLCLLFAPLLYPPRHHLFRLNPFPLSYETTLSKSLTSSHCFNCLSSAAVDDLVIMNGGKVSESCNTKPKQYAGQWQAVREAYPEKLCGCTLVNRSFCLAGCPDVPPCSTYQAIIKHDR